MPIICRLSSRHVAPAGAVLSVVLALACHRVPHARDTQTEARSLIPATDELLAADRAWSARAAQAHFPEALGAMFADTVRMPVRDKVVKGRVAVLAAVSATPDTGATVSWVPVRAAVSGDGKQGFTAGVQFLTRVNGQRVAARYLAYWVRGGDRTWKVAAWRRRPLTHMAPDTAMLPPLPSARNTNASDADARQHRAALMAAEQEFSDLANRIGVGAAFAQLGDGEAINMGRPDQAGFVRGASAIATLVAGGQPLDAPSAIVWRADDAIVASSGDLGITFGVIRPKAAPENGANAGAAFFTIWRKSSRTAPWRYVAE